MIGALVRASIAPATMGSTGALSALIEPLGRCSALEAPCPPHAAGGGLITRRSLFAQLTAGEIGTVGGEPSGHQKPPSSAVPAASSGGGYVPLGCFDDAKLHQRGINVHHARIPPERPHNAAAAVRACGTACGAYRYFGVKALSGNGWCLCGSLATVEWQRDTRGMDQLKRLTLRPL